MTKEDREKLQLGNFVKTLGDAITARAHLTHEWAFRWVFVPLFALSVLVCLTLFTLDALAAIAPMRDSLVSVIKTVLAAAVGSSAIGAGLASFFPKKSSDSD